MAIMHRTEPRLGVRRQKYQQFFFFFFLKLQISIHFVVELVKFISNFRSIKFFIALKKINNMLRGAKCKFIETNC